jgi:hypothetical protein
MSAYLHTTNRWSLKGTIAIFCLYCYKLYVLMLYICSYFMLRLIWK